MTRSFKPIRYVLTSMLALSLFTTGCGGGSPEKSSSTSGNYNETKQMVVDILKTKEAQKAIKESSGGSGKMSIQSTGDPKAMEDHLKTQTHEMMQDPKFAAALAKAMQEENKKLLKNLMKDPEYQKMMLSIMKDPEHQKTVTQSMQSPAYRQQTMTIMKEALQSPMFRMEMVTLMQKAQEQLMKPETKGKEQKGGQQGGQQKGGGKGGGGGGK
ncbi:spore germination protein D [Aneurinibacillus soli]|uniref:Spore germination protein GerD n=1 Tax=Aneurinibacillus soli TaxID=1500254 RepID=A0A0U5AVU4_9BACL|nr:spore germination lipoprotein GerD [Aneurinibacillus soli]PYE57547.1 spore germination protein D [Aneurinibacillus soli]BAU26064.1 Spore germination protein GerD precursor [Aneurinibacillus soli]